MKKNIISKNYLITKLREAKNVVYDENNYCYIGKSYIYTDYEPISKIEIIFTEEENFKISFFEKHNWKVKERRASENIMSAVKEIGSYLPNSLKLNNNF